MRQLILILCGPILVLAGCGAPAPAAAPAPTSPPPAPTTAPAVAAAKPSPAVSPVASPIASPAASPAASPVAAASPSPSPGPAVNTALLSTGPTTSGFVLQSSAFTEGSTLPSQFSCDAPGGGQSPPLSWSGAPTGTRAFALVDQDPDAGAGGSAFTHWVVYNIPASASQIEANQPAQETLPGGALQGQNGRRVVGYQGACPPAGAAAHHYTFQLFALDGPLTLRPGASIVELQQAMNGHILGQTRLVALFGH